MALAAPIVLAMLLQSLYALVDLAFVRQLGEKAVAGLAVSFQVFFLILAVSQVIAVSALSTISQAYGGGRVGEARRIFTAHSIIGLAVGVVASVLAYLLAEAYVATFTQDPEAATQGLAYFRVSTASFLLQLMLIVFGSGFRGSGDTVTPMKLMAGSVLVNLALDPLLIFGWGPVPALGIAGAAWATVISQALAVLLYLVILSRRRDERGLGWARPKFDRGLARSVVAVGLPAGIQFFLLSAVIGIVLRAMRPYGPAWTATAGGGFRVLQQTLLPMVALGTATAAAVGQNIGARKPDRVARASLTSLRWAVMYAIVVAVILYFGGSILGHVFIKDPSHLPVAVTYFEWSAPVTVAVALTFIPTWVLQAAGKAWPSLIAAIVRIGLLLALVFWVIPAFDLPPKWIFGASTASALVEGILGVSILAWYLRCIHKDGIARGAERIDSLPPESVG